MIPLPKSARVRVLSKLADSLFYAVRKLPPTDDKALYDVRRQATFREIIRTNCAEGFDWLVEEIRSRLIKAPYCALVTGLRFDEFNYLLVALTSAFGSVVDPCNQSWSRLVRYIQPSTDRSISGLGVLNEKLHTDGTDWMKPNDLTCLLCIQPDQNSGGRSRLLDRETLLAELDRHLSKEIISILYNESVPWRIIDELGGGVTWEPVFTMNSLRWMRYTIDLALRENYELIPASVSASLTALEQVLEGVESMRGLIDFAMESGELLIIHNKRCLHARTPISNPSSSRRLLLRTKIECSQNQLVK